jgi:ADP-ribosylation factor GTPase-activating protein 2/3
MTLASTRTSSTGMGTGVRPAKKGLGAKKAAPVDFAGAECHVAAEAEQICQLGYDCEHEEASAWVACKAAALKLKNKSATMAVSTGASSANVDKLGAGVKKLGFSAFPHAQPVTAPKACILPLWSLAGVA